MLFAGAECLKDSQLVHSNRFGYYSAMCASELMDPKMDMGMRIVNSRIVQDRLGSGELPLDLDAPNLLAVMDKLLQCEVHAHRCEHCSILSLFCARSGLGALEIRCRNRCSRACTCTLVH